MPKKDLSESKELEGESMIIESENHYDQLIEEGFEVINLQFSWHKATEQLGVQATMQLKKDGKLFLANANKINDLALSLKNLYSFELKKPVFTKTSELGWGIDHEESLINMIIGKYKNPLKSMGFNSSNKKKIFELMKEWVAREKNIRYGLKGKREIFYLICIITEKSGIVSRKNFHKELITLQEIKKINEDARESDSTLALSFFYLSPKIQKEKKLEDILIGCILYDVKDKSPLCFNIQSGISFDYKEKRQSRTPVEEIAEYLFESGVDENLVCKSFVPLPIDSPWYTPLPWICYSVLANQEIQYLESVSELHKISLPEFFTFGATPPPDERNSFSFYKFSSDKKGRASTNLQFFDNSKQLQYNFRFDRSKGEPLVHIDFAYYDGEQKKIIEHFPIDLEKIYSFNSDLYVAIIIAGLFDSYFTTIIKTGLKNLEKIIKKNPLLRYPFKWIWIIDTAIIWLNENKEGYKILEKLMRGDSVLNDFEKQMVQKINENRLDLIVEDEDCTNFGLSYLGYMVFQRYKRGQTDILMNP